mgnify:CR=1 FL=1
MTAASDVRDVRRLAPVVLPERLWRERERRHHDAVDSLTRDHLHRRQRGTPHPVVDFLFTYYRTSVGTIRRWHPGPGVLLENAHHDPRAQWRHYRRATLHGRTGLIVDPDSVLARGGTRLRRTRDVVASTASRPGAMGCFGLHEWAMLYRTGAEGTRHGNVPLRVSRKEIDDVVRGSRLRCTHFDAFRFFTEPARPLNERPLTRREQLDHEQPACLHAGMDIYAYTAALEAGAPGELLLDALRAAFTAREIDMRSSPYDLSQWGLNPIPVETPHGRAEFVAFQRAWITRTQALRSRYLRAVRILEALSDTEPAGHEATSGQTG